MPSIAAASETGRSVRLSSCPISEGGTSCEPGAGGCACSFPSWNLYLADGPATYVRRRDSAKEAAGEAGIVANVAAKKSRPPGSSRTVACIIFLAFVREWLSYQTAGKNSRRCRTLDKRLPLVAMIDTCGENGKTEHGPKTIGCPFFVPWVEVNNLSTALPFAAPFSAALRTPVPIASFGDMAKRNLVDVPAAECRME